MPKFINVKYDNNVCIITFNRDEKRNAFSNEMSNEVLTTIQKAENKCNAIVLTANISSFIWSSGHDLTELNDINELLHDSMFDLFNGIANSPIPVICAIDGDVYAGGVLLTLFSDLVIATTRSRFCMPINKMGIPLPVSCYALAANNLGLRKAKEMFFTADLITAKDAYDHGLINNIVSNQVELMQRVNSIVNGISSCLPEGVAYTKDVFNALAMSVSEVQKNHGIDDKFKGLSSNPKVLHRIDALLKKVKKL